MFIRLNEHSNSAKFVWALSFTNCFIAAELIILHRKFMRIQMGQYLYAHMKGWGSFYNKLLYKLMDYLLGEIFVYKYHVLVKLNNNHYST